MVVKFFYLGFVHLDVVQLHMFAKSSVMWVLYWQHQKVHLSWGPQTSTKIKYVSIFRLLPKTTHLNHLIVKLYPY